MEHLTPEEREKIKAKLLAKKTELESELSRIAERDEKIKGNWKASYENLGDEWDDSAQEVAMHDISVSLEHSLESHLHRIDEAIMRFEKGTYGLCEVDGKPIPAGRLLVMPETTRCQDHL